MPLDPELEPHFDEAARLTNLDPMLLRALASGESSFRSDATSPKGASGLMQIMPETAQRYGVKDVFDPVQAIYGAANILNDHLTKAEAAQAAGANIVPVDEALRSYFAGPSGENRGPLTAQYPGYIANKYRELQARAPDGNSGLQQPVSEADYRQQNPGGILGSPQQPLSANGTPIAPPTNGIDALAAAKGPMPPPGTVASNVRPPAGTPDTLDAAPPGVAALAALSGQGTAPPPQVASGGNATVVPLVTSTPGGTNGTVPAGAPTQTVQTEIPSDAELLKMLDAVTPKGTPAGVAPTTTSVQGAPVQRRVPLADPANAMYPPSMIPQLLTFPAGVAIAQHIAELGKQGFQLNRDGTQSPIRGGPADPDILQQNKNAEAIGHTTGTPSTARQGETTGIYTEPGVPPPLVFHEAFQSPRLPEGAQTQPPPPGSPPGTPPAVVTLPNAAEAIRTAAGAEAAGKGSVEPTTITIGGREYPVTHEQFRDITQRLNIPGLATGAAQTAAAPSAPASGNAPTSTPTPITTGPLAGAVLPASSEGNVGKVYQSPAQAGRTEVLKEEYDKTVLPAFTHAQDSLKALTAIESAMQNYRTGPTAQTRLAFEKALQDFSQMAGVAPDSDLAKQIASGEIINKEGVGLGFSLARTLGARESQQVVEQAIKTNPGLATSPQGNTQLIGLIRQQMQRDLDRRDFYDSWFRATGNYDGAGSEFNRLHPVEQYVTKALPYRAQTPDEASKLPPGSFFVDPQGVTRTVPIKAYNG